MIIKIKIKNNKFTKYAKEYLKEFYNNSFDLQMNCFPYDEKFFEIKHMITKILHKEKNFTKDEKEILKKYVIFSFNYFLKSQDLNDFDYIKNKYIVSILDDFKDRNENKQSSYWLQHSGVVIVQ